jgi:hypothetical protein
LVSKRKASLPSPAENKRSKGGFDLSDDSEDDSESRQSASEDEEGLSAGARSDNVRSESEEERDQTVPRVTQWLDEDDLDTDDEDDDSSAVFDVNEQENSSRTVRSRCSARFDGIGAQPQTFTDVVSKRFVWSFHLDRKGRIDMSGIGSDPPSFGTLLALHQDPKKIIMQNSKDSGAGTSIDRSKAGTKPEWSLQRRTDLVKRSSKHA